MMVLGGMSVLLWGILIGFVCCLIYKVVKEFIFAVRFRMLNAEWLEIHAELLEYIENDQRMNAVAAFRRLRANTNAQMRLMGMEVLEDAD